MATRLGPPYDTNPDKIIFNSVTSGSVILSGNIGVAGSTNPNNVLSAANSITTSNTAVGSFNLIGASYSANGFTSSTSSGANLALILGVCIPLVVIVLFAVIFMLYKKQKKGDIETNRIPEDNLRVD